MPAPLPIRSDQDLTKSGAPQLAWVAASAGYKRWDGNEADIGLLADGPAIPPPSAKRVRLGDVPWLQVGRRLSGYLVDNGSTVALINLAIATA